MTQEQASEALVLVVEDDENSRDMLSRRLARCGFRVHAVENGETALVDLQDLQPDIVLLDIALPGITGIDVLRSIREGLSLSELPVIMTTARGRSEDVIQALSCGANDYVMKPLDFPVVLARVNTQIEIARLRREREEVMLLKDEFLAVASHELRAPLALIVGYSDMLKDKVESLQFPSKLVDSISRAGQEMQEIIEDFLELNALRSGQMHLERSPFELSVLIQETVASFDAHARSHGVEIAADPDLGQTPLEADERRVRQVIRNLLDNAVKYCSEGDRVLVSAQANDEVVRVQVCDTGPGLGTDQPEELFVRFQRTERLPARGERSTRMGLSICRQIVELHGGKIGAQNNPQGGSVFWFELPRGG